MRIRIATRKSPLALRQAHEVRAQLCNAHAHAEVTLLAIESSGDKTMQPLAEIGGKGLFIKELEHALLRGGADIAVHSMKDVPSQIPPGLQILCAGKRADARDAVVSGGMRIAELPRGARIGTGSARRISQLRAHFPHLQFATVRGNLGTRLRKLDDGEYDALVLAAAGLHRLQLQARISEILPPELCLPAPGQGALAIEYRAGDARMRDSLIALQHAPTAACVTAERAAAARLELDCHAPFAAHAETHAGGMRLRALVASADGARIIRAEDTGEDAVTLGNAVAAALLAQGAEEILRDAA